MKDVMNYENIRYFAYTNAELIKGEVKGIVLTFHGLGFDSMYDHHSENDKKDAENGILVIVPYYNPWCWMNKQTVDYVDDIVDIMKEHFGLDDSIKVTASGGSMGGQCALVYTCYSKHKPFRCVTNCPVCDMVFHYTERVDLPRTIYSAYGCYEGTLQEALESQSPYHLAEKMPDIEYVQYHCTEDDAVNKELHSDKFVAKMQALGRNVRYIAVPDRGHCSLPDDVLTDYDASIRKGMI